MITGELKSKVDRLWDAFWSGGISNPLEVIEQITYLLFIKRLDELHTAQEKKANRLKKPIENPIFNRKQQSLRWSRFRNDPAPAMFKIVSDKVFPFIKELKSAREDSTYQHHMKDARFTIPNAGLLAKVVDMIDKIRWRIATRRAIFTSPCSARSRPPDRKGSFARRVPSSG